MGGGGRGAPRPSPLHGWDRPWPPACRQPPPTPTHPHSPVPVAASLGPWGAVGHADTARVTLWRVGLFSGFTAFLGRGRRGPAAKEIAFHCPHLRRHPGPRLPTPDRRARPRFPVGVASPGGAGGEGSAGRRAGNPTSAGKKGPTRARVELTRAARRRRRGRRPPPPSRSRPRPAARPPSPSSPRPSVRSPGASLVGSSASCASSPGPGRLRRRPTQPRGRAAGSGRAPTLPRRLFNPRGPRRNSAPAPPQPDPSGAPAPLLPPPRPPPATPASTAAGGPFRPRRGVPSPAPAARTAAPQAPSRRDSASSKGPVVHPAFHPCAPDARCPGSAPEGKQPLTSSNHW